MKIPISLIFLMFTINSMVGQVSFGEPVKFNNDWRFQKGDIRNAYSEDFNDSRWRELDLPHDWSVEGPYSPTLSSGTGFLPVGIAWYRKTFEVPAEMKNKKVYIYFEGVYRYGEVFVNGISLGIRPNGYISYMYDLSPYIDPGKTNTIAVRVDRSHADDSRFYTGAGIYGNVYLIYANPIHIDQWGVYYATPVVKAKDAIFHIQTSVKNTTREQSSIVVIQELLDKEQKIISTTSGKFNVPAGVAETFKQDLKVRNPVLWSVDDPYLYQLRTSVYQGKDLVDRTQVNAGIRTFSFDPNNGFSLNGNQMKVKGVCLHHDAGSLGAAVPEEVWERRLVILKSLGVNAIRTGHKPMLPEFYKKCDELGFLVINEAYDEWELPKKKWVEGWNVGTPGFNGMAEFFEEWWETDTRDLILRDRNHPSIFMWSIGNEIDYPHDPYSHPVLDQEGIRQQHRWGHNPKNPNAERLGEIAKKLAAVVRTYDTSRPITAGLAAPVMSNMTEYPFVLDVVGYNYTERRYADDHATYPERILYGSENGHSLEAWKAVRDNDYIFGQFLWTGIEFLGESRPWPARGSRAGMLDLAGFKKPRAYFRESLWTEEPMVYLGTGREHFPYWNFKDGDTVRITSYTNCHGVQLMLNGRKIGAVKEYNDETGTIFWDIPYESGKLEAIGYKSGQEVARNSLETSKRPHAITARVWNNTISREKGVAQIEIQIVDEDGKPVFLSDNEITCITEGPVRVLGLEAGNPTDTGDYTNNNLRVYQGRLLAYIQSTGSKGTAKVTFTSPWLEGTNVEIDIR